MDYERLIHLLLTDPYMAYVYVDMVLLISHQVTIDGIFYAVVGVFCMGFSTFAWLYIINYRVIKMAAVYLLDVFYDFSLSQLERLIIIPRAG